MVSFNPYFVDEIVAQSGGQESFFGLISNTRADESELFGYEITLSGRVVLPELCPLGKDELETNGQIAICATH